MRQLIRIITPKFLLFLCLFLSVGVYSGCNDDDDPEPEPSAEVTPASRALWVWASAFTSGGEDIQAIVDQLAESNVNEVYLNCGLRSFRTETLIGQLTDFITKAHAEEIKVHLWFMINTSEDYITANPGAHIYHCPYPQGGYIDPYPIDDDRVNLLWPGYKEDVLENVRYFLSNFDCDGIHLDGIRYSHFVYSFDEYSLQEAADLGVDTTYLLSLFNTAANYTTYATNSGFVDLYVDGDEDVVKWVEMRKDVISEYIAAIRETIEEVKPGLELTAAFMPEGATSPDYSDVFYAQNYALHSTLLDMISPMAYFLSYGETTDWITDVTYGAKALADPACRIATGLQAFSVSGVSVTPSELNEQIRNAFNMGSDGVVIFRYGTITDAASWNVLKVWFGKDWERVQ